jgi:hypothetical protein
VTTPSLQPPRPHPLELSIALACGAAVFAILLPWPRPAVDLRECALARVGRYGVQCGLATAPRWLRKDLLVYEDGVRLREADRAGDPARVHPGSFHNDRRTLTFSAIDGSDPLTNGRRYQARPLRPGGTWGTGGRPLRLALGGLLAAALAGLCWWRRTRREPLLWSVAVAVAAACLAVQAICVLAYAPVHVDTSYALAAAEAVAQGAIPYTTLVYHYSPLGLYLFAAWGGLWPGAGAPPYPWYLAVVLLHEAACAGIVFAFLRRAGCARFLALLTSVCFFSMTMWFDGARILFEPLYLLPVLAAASLALSPARRAALLAGAAAALAFLIKQYGAFAFVALVPAALATGGAWRERLIRVVSVAGGFIVLIAAATIALAAAGMRLDGLLAQVLGPEYPRRYEWTWIRLFLATCPIAIPAALVPAIPGAWPRPAVRVAACFALASLLPLYFRQHQYYLLNVAPWAFLLFALGVQVLADRGPRRAPVLQVAAAALLLTMPLRAAENLAALASSELRSEQLRRTQRMNDAWPPGRRTLLLQHPGFYYLTRYRSPDEAVFGYRFPNAVSADELKVGFREAEAVWIDPQGMYARGADNALRAAGSSTEHELRANGFELQTVIEDRLFLYVRPAPP